MNNVAQFLRVLVSSLTILCVARALAAAPATEKKSFDVPAEPAASSLRRFSTQSGQEVIFAGDLLGEVRTKAVRGELLPSEALEMMLVGTGLNATRDASTGAFMVNRAPDPNVQRAAVQPTARAARREASREGSDAIELSPFVITETSEPGWVATETLAGSRLRTNFRDVPNQIETLTKEFMQDLGITNFADALIYTSNVENDTEYLPTSAGNVAAFPETAGRVRGVGSGTLSRNFFQTRNPTDNYNLDRATVASGPNAILFGLGSPAGILDATPARAQMRNRYGFTLQYDSEDSRRGTFDANVVAVPDKVAIRFMGLSKESYTEKRPNFDRDDRIYGTLTFKPFKNTTLILQGERDSRSWDRAGRVTPTDFVTPWLIADRVAGSGYSSAKPVYDNTSFSGITTNRIFNQASENPVMIQGASGPLTSWRNSVTVRSPGSLPGVDPTFDAGAVYSILDPAIFPFDVNIVGTSRANQIHAYNKTAILEQKITESLFLELAYNREKGTNHQLSSGGTAGGFDFRLDVDANQYLPGTTTPNPNVGKYYVQGNSQTRMIFFEREDMRATLSYEFDSARRFANRGPILKWLGRHRLAGLYTESESTNTNQFFNRTILDSPTLPGVTLRASTFQNWATNATRFPLYRHYLGNPYEPTVAAASFTDIWTLNDANGQPYNVYLFDTPLKATDGKRLGGSGAAAGSRNKADALIFAWQGFFLPDRQGRERLVLTYGYREDSARSANFDAASIRQDFSGLYPVIWDAQFGNYGVEQQGTNRNVGIIVRPFRWLSLSYNKSTTFDLNVGRFDPYGNDIPGASGSGRDYGVRLELLQDKLVLKVNKYETNLGPARAANQINNYKTQILNIENRVVELNPGVPRINVTDGNRRGFPNAPFNDYNISSDASGEGYEAEINFSPTRSWNIRFNGAKSEAKETNIGREWFAWIAERLPVWQGVVATNGEVDAAGQPASWNTAPFNASQPTGQTLQQYYQSALVGQALAFISAVDGRANPSVRDYRFNTIVNYRFHEGRLKGFNIGGALRYRSAPTLGYGVTRNAVGTTLLDIQNVFKGEPERFVDFMAGYRGRMKAFGGFNYRLQLNVRNLLNENDAVPMGALTTGAVFRLATVDSRVTSITFGVDF